VIFAATPLLNSALTNSLGTAVARVKCSAPADLARLDHAWTVLNGVLLLAFPQPSCNRLLLDRRSRRSSPDHSYPSRLAVELQQLFPGHPITVLNRGVNGEEASDMVARLDQTVLAEKPDLSMANEAPTRLCATMIFNRWVPRSMMD
jgi:hypothetical protein